MSALPRRVVVAHPSALRKIVTPAQAGAQSPSPRPPATRLPGQASSPRGQGDLPARIFAMALGIAVFIVLWAFIAKFGRIPDPLSVGKEAVKIFSDPFYRNGPNDQGIGWNVLMSRGRVGIGFGLAAAGGLPPGVRRGGFPFPPALGG